MRFLLVLVCAAWMALGAPGDPLAALQPDPPPAAHHKAVVDWTYVYIWHTRDGRKVRCVVPPKGRRVCRVIP